MAAVDELRVAFITRTDMLMRAVSDLSAAISAISSSAGQTPAIQKMRFADEEDLKQEFKKAVTSVLPATAVVAVVSKGDDDLVDLDGRVAHHFPQSMDGRYAGYHPANSAEAIAQVEAARSKGTQYLLFPRSAYWWLDYYCGLKRYLIKHCRLLSSAPEVCRIYSFGKTIPSAPAVVPEARPYLSYPGNRTYHKKIKETVKRVLPADAVITVVSKGDNELLDLGGRSVYPFTQNTNGRAAPENDRAAIRQLELRRAEGAEYLLLPNTAIWWLEYFPEFKRHLEKCCRLVVAEQHVCMIWDIRGKKAKPTARSL